MSYIRQNATWTCEVFLIRRPFPPLKRSPWLSSKHKPGQLVIVGLFQTTVQTLSSTCNPLRTQKNDGAVDCHVHVLCNHSQKVSTSRSQRKDTSQELQRASERARTTTIKHCLKLTKA